LLHNLNYSNRRMRTRTSGGVGGEQPGEPTTPYPDLTAAAVTLQNHTNWSPL